MGRRAVGWVVATMFVVLPASCADLGSLSRGAPQDAGADRVGDGWVDVGSDAANDGSVDAGVDGAPNEAAEPVDSSTDLVAPPCPAASFCDDFDHGPLGAMWTGVSTTALGTLSLDSNAVSPPNSMRATIGAGTASDRQALLDEAFPAMKAIDCTFDLFVEQTSTTERARYVSLFVNNPVWSGYELNVWIQTDGSTLLEEWGIYADDGGSFITGMPGAPIAQGRWVHVEFLANYMGSAQLYADGNPISSIRMASQTPLGETFYLGLRSQGTGSWGALFDNLVCTPTL